MSIRIFVRSYLVERGTGKPGYRWVQGYNEISPDNGARLFPSVTRSEAQSYCRLSGERAVFCDSDDEVTKYIESL